ncbi:hypothetical protein BCGT_0156 [Mycobacterium tuberculosis variant bovis BCG str. ATCC 35743]|nr:hypothetical protein BCGT_0156 [Mycobacterium tuberculosis variant bovis BCG str. ATCC 35743]
MVGEGLATRTSRRGFRLTANSANARTHVYTKLGFTSRLQLAQAAARRT